MQLAFTIKKIIGSFSKEKGEVSLHHINPPIMSVLISTENFVRLTEKHWKSLNFAWKKLKIEFDSRKYCQYS
jgi:trehalose/maltose hydrolase-like predicted phosphorylase